MASSEASEVILDSKLQVGFELSAKNFLRLLPARPYCSDDLTHGLVALPQPIAATKSLIQLNGPSLLRWMIFDLDYRGAYLIHRDVDVPQPNIIMIRKSNRHAHAAYLLENAVAKHHAARLQPLKFFAAVERGLARRTNADRRYRGLIAKNPLHPCWEVEWRQSQPYSLPELSSWLSAEDIRLDNCPAETLGLGRNCDLFDSLRHYAYGEVLDYKRRGEAFEAWQRQCLAHAIEANYQFSIRLGPSEVAAVVKSVSRWTWKHLSDAHFSQLQSARGSRGAAERWKNHTPARDVAESSGISLSTLYRRRREILRGADVE